MLSQQQLKIRRRSKVLARSSQQSFEENNQQTKFNINQNSTSTTTSTNDAFARYKLMQNKELKRKLYSKISKCIGFVIALLTFILQNYFQYISQILFFVSIVIMIMVIKLNEMRGSNNENNDQNSFLKKNAVLSKIQHVNNILGINQYLKAIINIYSSYIIGIVIILFLKWIFLKLNQQETLVVNLE